MSCKRTLILLLVFLLIVPVNVLAAYPSGARTNIDSGGIKNVTTGYQWNNAANYPTLFYRLDNQGIGGNFTDYMYESNWFSSVDGSDTGKKLILMRPRSSSALGRTLAQPGDISWWASKLNGNPNYVQRFHNSFPTKVINMVDESSYNRAYSRDLAKWSGAILKTEGTGQYDDGPNGNLLQMGRAAFTTTPFPSPVITSPSSARAGESITVNFSGQEYYPHSEYGTRARIDYVLKMDGGILKQGTRNSSSFTDSHVISSGICTSGTHTFELTLSDIVERAKTVKKTITINGSADGCGPPPTIPDPDPDPEPGPDETVDPGPPPVPSPDLSCNVNTNVSPVSNMGNSKLEADPNGKILESAESGEFDVQKYGIPSSEYLKVNGRSEKYLADYLYTKKAGTTTYNFKVTRDYIYRWETVTTKPDGGKLTTVHYAHRRNQQSFQDPYPVSFWLIGHLNVYELQELYFQNYALPGGNALVKNLQKVSASGNHDPRTEAHVFPKSCSGIYLGTTNVSGQPPSYGPSDSLQGSANLGSRPPNVKNDYVQVEGNVSMSNSLVTQHGPTPTLIPRALQIELSQSSLLIDPLKLNKWKTDSSITANYKSSFTVNTSPGTHAVTGYSPTKINTVTVHTPVVMYAKSTDDKEHDQRTNPPSRSTPANPDKDRHAIILDRPFTVTLPTSGQHLDAATAPGYGDRDYKKYIRKTDGKQVQFPFDVYTETKQGFYPKNTWINVPTDMEQVKFFLPVWVPEGEYVMKFRTIAINAPADPQEEHHANLNKDAHTPNQVMPHHGAYDTIAVDVVGRLYDFRVTDILDYQWGPVFRPEVGRLEHTGNYYWVGDKGIDGAPRGNQTPFVLPVRHGSHPDGLQNVAVKTGYQFKFDMKTKGNLFGEQDAIRITPSFYFVNKDGSDRRPVDVYYHNDANYFTKVGSEQDKEYREVKLNEPLRNVEEKQLLDTAAYLYRHPFDQYKDIVGSVPQQTFTKDFMRTYSKEPQVTGPYGWQILNRNLRTYTGPDLSQVPSNAMIPAADVKARQQMWYGEYSLPADIWVVDEGRDIAGYGVQHRLNKQSPIFLQDGYIIVNFNIETIANGDSNNPRLQYHKGPLNNQWKLEGFKYSFTDAYGGQFALKDGDVLFYHGDQSSYDDFGARVTH